MTNESKLIQLQKVAHSRLPQTDLSTLQFGKVFSDHMFISDYDGQSWGNNRIVPYDRISFSPATLFIHYGQSIFEGMKAHKADNGDVLVFRPEMNLARLNASAERLCMPAIDKDIFMEGLRESLDIDRDWIPTQEGSSMYIRPFMIGTDEFLGVQASETYKFFILNSPSGPYYGKPVKVKVEREFSRAADGGTGYAKAAGNYAGSLYPAMLAKEQGFDQLLWTDSKTHTKLEEAGTMNLMFVIDGKLITPKLSGSILPGITRDSVLHLAKAWGMEVEERDVLVEEVREAMEKGAISEAFGVGTAATIAHIESISIDGVNMTLPAIEGREFANRVKTYLADLKTGRIEDEYNWMFKI